MAESVSNFGSSKKPDSIKSVLSKVPHKQNGNAQGVKQIQIQNLSDVVKPVHFPYEKSIGGKQVLNVMTKNKEAQIVAKPKMQVTLQAPESIKSKLQMQTIENKDEAVGNIAKALKKVQSQKIVANVSRPDKVKSATPKFESYEDYINATKPLDKSVSNDSQEVTKITDVTNVSIIEKTIVASEELIESINKPLIAWATPRTPIKMKRRPLTTENPGVSGITRSSSLGKSVELAIDSVIVDQDTKE